MGRYKIKKIIPKIYPKMNFSKLSFAVMMLLNSTGAINLENKADASQSPAEEFGLSQFMLNTCSFHPDRPGDTRKNLNVSLKYKKNYESEYFHVEGDSLRMAVPLYGARTSPNTKNPRMELSETYHWPLPEGENIMRASVTI